MRISKSFFTAALALFTTPAFADPPSYMDPLLVAIWEVESSRNPGGVPFYADSGKTAGPLCISAAYFADSRKPGSWPESVFDLEYSCQVFRAYMARWGSPQRIQAQAPGMSREEAWSRLHNGGPQALKAKPGTKKRQNLDRYWGKVKKILKRLEQTSPSRDI
tara:strand:- start:10 stop:495 length:486 start_codon:yes stop_codon:yes gene_type:complete